MPIKAPEKRPENPLRSGPYPVSGRVYSLEVVGGPHAGRRLELTKRTLVGRGLGSFDVENDIFMSPGHASFFYRGGELWVADGRSASGTWVSIPGVQTIGTGDSFSAGLQRFKFLGPLDIARSERPWAYGAPRPPACFRIEHVLVGDRPSRIWIVKGSVTIGSEAAIIRFPDDRSLSPVHVEVKGNGTSAELTDRSTTGTYVMIPSSGEAKLSEDTKVRLGTTVFRVVSQ
jgi:hypothetical protein